MFRATRTALDKADLGCKLDVNLTASEFMGQRMYSYGRAKVRTLCAGQAPELDSMLHSNATSILLISFASVCLNVACSSSGGADAPGSGGAIAGAAGAANPTSGGSNGGSGTGGAAAMGGGGGGGAGSGSGGGSAGGAVEGNCSPPIDVFSPITTLSQTGCVELTNPTKPVARAVSYEVNSPLWSDLADKTRAFVLPTGGKIHVRNCSVVGDCPNGAADDGRWLFPVGSVMIKTFSFDAKLVETRLFMHVDANNWVGYSYQWNEDQSDARIVSSDGAQVTFHTGTRDIDWHYPSQKDCLNCHNDATGATIGPETAQMNRMLNGSNQIDAMLALFEVPPAKPYKKALVTPYPSQAGTPGAATTEEKARSYLHANCGFCHRPGGNFANFDLRYDTPLSGMSICDTEVVKGAIANAPGKTKILVPGQETSSVLWLRMNEPDPNKGRMPQIASWVVDDAGVAAVGAWIKTIAACP